MSATHQPIGFDTAGQPRTYRIARHAGRNRGYRRLALAILGLDVKGLTSELRSARLSKPDQL
jgi:hypothetical protein